LDVTIVSDVHPLKRTTVLVVEDDHDLRASFRTCLALAGFLVREAPDGIHALRQIDQQPPDLVVLDLMLPNLSGLDVQQEIASNAYTRAIPIVVVTGTSLDLDHLMVSCILRKPILPDELVTAVQRCLTLRPPESPF
jgi:two-component system phosphate regulon response regulator PhoB